MALVRISKNYIVIKERQIHLITRDVDTQLETQQMDTEQNYNERHQYCGELRDT